MLLLRRDEPPHMAFQQEGERSFDFQDIAHQRAVVPRIKLVDVPEFAEKSAHHLIDEASRPIDFGDPCRKPLPDSEMPAFECQQVAGLQHARRPSRLDDVLARESRAFGMNINVECEIEAELNRRRDRCFDGDDQVPSARRLIARSHERRMMSLPG